MNPFSVVGREVQHVVAGRNELCYRMRSIKRPKVISLVMMAMLLSDEVDLDTARVSE